MTKENQMDDLMQIAIEAGLIGKEPNGFDRVKLTKAEVRFAQLVTKKAVEAERLKIAEALRQVGLTLVTTNKGYQVMNLGQITAGPSR